MTLPIDEAMGDDQPLWGDAGHRPPFMVPAVEVPYSTKSGAHSAAGALKHFFDTVYYPILDHVAERPYGLWVHGNNGTVGAVNAVEKLATGLALAKAADVLEVVGGIDAGVRWRAYELGGPLAATLMKD